MAAMRAIWAGLWFVSQFRLPIGWSDCEILPIIKPKRPKRPHDEHRARPAHRARAHWVLGLPDEGSPNRAPARRGGPPVRRSMLLQRPLGATGVAKVGRFRAPRHAPTAPRAHRRAGAAGVRVAQAAVRTVQAGQGAPGTPGPTLEPACAQPTAAQLWRKLAAWVNEGGGYVHEALVLADDAPCGARGVVALSDLGVEVRGLPPAPPSPLAPLPAPSPRPLTVPPPHTPWPPALLLCTLPLTPWPTPPPPSPNPGGF